MSAFDQAVGHVLNLEGGYTNDPSDSGGETNRGITVAVARAQGYQGPMEELTLAQATSIAKKAYWDVLDLDTVSAYDYPLALKLFEAGFHCGPGKAAEWLQRSLNASNNEQKFWPDIKVDNSIGPRTLMALQAMFTRRGGNGMAVLRRSVNCFLGVHYTTLAERRQKDEKFWFGWMMNRVQ